MEASFPDNYAGSPVSTTPPDLKDDAQVPSDEDVSMASPSSRESVSCLPNPWYTATCAVPDGPELPMDIESIMERGAARAHTLAATPPPPSPPRRVFTWTPSNVRPGFKSFNDRPHFIVATTSEPFPDLGPRLRDEECRLPFGALSLRWADDRYWWAMFAPKDLKLVGGGVFDCLNFGREAAPVESFTRSGQPGIGPLAWRITDDALRSWEFLDRMLEDLRTLVETGPFPLNTVPPRRPSSQFRAGCSFSSRKEAVNAAIRARMSFIAYMTYLSAIAAYGNPDLWDPEQPQCVWHRTPDALRSIFERTWIFFRQSCPRVGAIIDVSHKYQWTDALRRFAFKREVPLWLYFGPDIPHCLSPVFEEFCPTQSEIDGCLALISQAKTDTTAASSNWHTPTPAPPAWSEDVLKTAEDLARSRVVDPNGPNPGSRQKRGQHPRQYFEERDLAVRTARASESAEQKALWDQRLEDNKKRPSNTARVFHWRPVRGEFWTREFVGKKNVEALWQSTAETQRRYDPLVNEWDVWEELDPFATTPDDLEYEDENHEDILPGHRSGPASSPVRRDRPPPTDHRGRSPYRGVKYRCATCGGSCSRPPCRRRPARLRSRESRRRSPSPRRHRRSPSPYRHRRPPSPRNHHRPPSSYRSRRSPSPYYRNPSSSSFRRRRSASPDRRHHSRSRSQHRENDRSRSPRHCSRSRTAPMAQIRHSTDHASTASRQQGPAEMMARQLRQGQSDTVMVVQPILDVLRKRYGLRSDSKYVPGDKPLSRCYDEHKLPWTLSIDPQKDPIPQTWLLVVRDFVGHLVNGLPPPAAICDVVAECPVPFQHPIRSPTHGKFIAARKVHLQYKLLQGTWEHTDESREGYMLDVQEEPGKGWKWGIVVESALTVAELVRCQIAPSKLEIIRELASRGIPFISAVPTTSSTELRVPSTTLRRVDQGLGMRLHNFQVDAASYQLYEDLRDRFFASSPHAALSCLGAGGILWRLAMQALTPESALDGPQGKHDRQSTILIDGRPHVIDALTVGEEQLVCGVYHILQYDHSAAQSASDFSWWPKQSTWLTSGANVGYWSSANEAWFQQRLERIRAGAAAPVNATTWKTLLKFKKTHTSAMLTKLESLTASKL